jgi:hypothetical protein
MILSFSGGGIRGVIPTRLAQRLERATGRPLASEAELLAGTSTGAILAAACALGIPADETLGLYVERARHIFPSRSDLGIFSWLKRCFLRGLVIPKYCSTGFASELKALFGSDVPIGEMSRRLLIITYDPVGRSPFMIKSWDPCMAEVPVWAAVLASCSVPGYFAPAHIHLKGSRRTLVDGGLVANDPGVCALAAVRRLQVTGVPWALSRPWKLIGFGTGSCRIPIRAGRWGILQWAPHIIRAMMDGGEATAYQLRHLLFGTYLALQMDLPTELAALDAARNVEPLMAWADAWAEGRGLGEMRTAARWLKGE